MIQYNEFQKKELMGELHRRYYGQLMTNVEVVLTVITMHRMGGLERGDVLPILKGAFETGQETAKALIDTLPALNDPELVKGLNDELKKIKK